MVESKVGKLFVYSRNDWQTAHHCRAQLSFQVSFTASFFLLYPGFGTLLYKSGVIFSVILAAIFFPDERVMLQHRRFQLGFLLALVGMVITIIADKNFGHIEFNLGVLLILTSALSWAFITALIKKWLSNIPISFAVPIVLTIVTPCYFLTDIVMSGGFRIPQASLSMWLIMIFSGILAIGIAHSSYYHSVPILGVALSASLDLSRPFLVALMSFFLYQESLTTLQIVGGVLLIFGSYLVIKLRFQQL